MTVGHFAPVAELSLPSTEVATGGVFPGCPEELLQPSYSVGLLLEGLGFLQVGWDIQVGPPSSATDTDNPAATARATGTAGSWDGFY